MSEILKLLLILIFISLLIVSLETLAHRKVLSAEFARKSLHILAGVLISLSPFIFDNFYYPFITAIAASLFSIAAVKFNFLPRIDPPSRGTLGTFFFSFSFAILLVFYWDNYKWLISLSYLLFVIGDAFAAIVGENSKRRITLAINSEPKTLQGALTIFATTFLLFAAFWSIFKHQLSFLDLSLDKFVIFNIIVSTVAMVVEILSRKGSDNIFLPIVISFTIFICVIQPQYLDSFALGFVLSILIVFISLRFKFLSIEGALSTFLLALFIYGLGEWKWTLPIFVFFLFSSILSKLSGSSKKSSVTMGRTKGSERDMMQVFANGGIAFITITLNFLFPNDSWYLVYLVSLSVSMTDTWSTEIGTWLGEKTFLITNLKTVNRGESGGVSLVGTIGGVFGSIVVISSGLIFVNLSVELFIMLVIFGTVGSVIDSILGASIQAKYYCTNCHSIVELKTHCNRAAEFKSGFGMMNNDLVNFSSVLIISIIFFTIL
ncbi:MAG: DUF92 domain-containing protein [Ignavibacteria bacterium]|nr:DUF92 domain-containing protein [Ignavibacteria bacterium]